MDHKTTGQNRNDKKSKNSQYEGTNGRNTIGARQNIYIL